MPLFALSKQRFDPHAAFAVRFLVRFGQVVAPDPIQNLLIDTAAQAASLLPSGTFCFERAVIAVFGIGPIASRPLSRLTLHKVGCFACRTDGDITFSVVLEFLSAKERGAMIVIRQGNVGMDLLAFDGNNVLFGAVLAVESRLAWAATSSESAHARAS